MQDLTKYDKSVIAVLCGVLLVVAIVLYCKNSRPLSGIKIINNSFSTEKSLKEIERKLFEMRKVGINSASREDIMQIPGIGEVLAERIVEFRKKRQTFGSLEELLAVEGIGEKKLEKIKIFLKVE